MSTGDARFDAVVNDPNRYICAISCQYCYDSNRTCIVAPTTRSGKCASCALVNAGCTWSRNVKPPGSRGPGVNRVVCNPPQLVIVPGDPQHYQTVAPQAHARSANTPAGTVHGVVLNGPPPLSNDCIVAGTLWGPDDGTGTAIPQLPHLPANLDVRALQTQLAAAPMGAGGASSAQIMTAISGVQGPAGAPAPLPSLTDVMAELTLLRTRADAMQNYMAGQAGAGGAFAWPP